MNIKLGNNVWKLQHIDLGPKVRGEIDPPSYANKSLKISTRLTKQQEVLEVVIHECLHGCLWALEEDLVDKTAADIAKVLYALGARIELAKPKPKRKVKRT